MERIDATYAYDAPTHSVAIAPESILSVINSEVGNTQPSTTTTIGLFTRDPIGIRGGYSLYGYVSEAPLVYVDFLGHQEIRPENPQVPVKPPKLDPDPSTTCLDDTSTTTEVQVCVRPVGATGGVGGHVYIKIICGDKGETYTWSGGPMNPTDDCKGKCKEQLRTIFFSFVRGSPEYPKDPTNLTHVCTTYTIEKSPKKLRECLQKVATWNSKCCVPYQGLPGVTLGPGCNSNCLASWFSSICLQPIKGGGKIELPDDRPKPVPGWGTAVPDCIKKLAALNGVVVE